MENKYDVVIEMMDYCEKNNVQTFGKLLDYCRKENRGWFGVLCDNVLIFQEFFVKQNTERLAQGEAYFRKMLS